MYFSMKLSYHQVKKEDDLYKIMSKFFQLYFIFCRGFIQKPFFVFINNYSKLKEMAEQWVPKKPNFGPPPPGYIAGLGRGATGFITRSDLGPARANAQVNNIKQSQIDDANYADSKYDSWQGYKAPLFSKNIVDQQDRQAEDAYDFCERKMDERRKKQRQQFIKLQLTKNKDQKAISEQFSDLKRQLAKVTAQQWQSIPQANDSSIKKKKKQRYTPVPDSMLVSLLSQGMNRTVQQDSNQDFREAKEILLRTKLDNMQQQSQRKGIDKIGYMTALSSNKIENQFLGDIKRARILLKSALNSNPNNIDLWVSAARVEELDGKIQDARNILKKAINQCSLSQDLWLQAARIERAQDSQALLVQALKKIPTSQKIWLAVARKQKDNKELKSKLLKKGLESIPQSVKLWRQLIQLQDAQQAKNLLYKAVQCLPKQIDLWIALAKLQTYDNAKKVLNQARKANPLSLAIWINAAKLQQTQSDDKEKIKSKIETILNKGRDILIKNGNVVSRQDWIQQALLSEKSQNLFTCQIIIKINLGYGLAFEEKQSAYTKDAELLEKERESIYTARFVYKYGVMDIKSRSLMEKMIDFQRRLQLDNKISDLLGAMSLGTKIFKDDGHFWCLMIDKFLQENNLQTAFAIIEKASSNLQESERQDILLKKVKILKLQNNLNAARIQLQILTQIYPGEKTVLEAIRLQYETQNYTNAWALCQERLKQTTNQKIYQIAVKIQRKLGNYPQAKKIIERAVFNISNAISLWQQFVNMEIEENHIGKARSIIDQALLKNPQNQYLYMMGIELQIKYGTSKEVNFIIAKAIKACPKNGQIWGIAIQIQPNQTRKKRASVAIEKCGENNYIFCAIAKTFWKQNKLDKAKKWLQNAVDLDLTNGDIWAYYFKFIMEKYPEERQIVAQKFHAVGVLQGRKWNKIFESQHGWKMSKQQILMELVQQIGDQIKKIH